MIMEAAIINRYGRDVEIKDVPMSMPGPNDVVIRVVAAAVNPGRRQERWS